MKVKSLGVEKVMPLDSDLSWIKPNLTPDSKEVMNYA